MPRYSHTQTAPLHWMMHLIGISMWVAAWFWGQEARPIAILLVASGGFIILCGLCCRSLTIRDEGDHLALRYGPLPLFSKRIPYAAIREAKTGRTAWIDGLGVHYVPGRGWTYNLWGRDCVEVSLDGQSIRLGTDDAANLAAFLRELRTGPADGKSSS